VWDDDEPDPQPAQVDSDRLERDLRWGRRPGQHLALELSVGLPDTLPLTGRGHDLDSHLFAVVDRLGPVRFDAAFASKRHEERSWIRIGPARPEPRTPGPPQVRTRTTASSASIDWKQQVHDAVLAATPAPAPPGPVAVQVRLTSSRWRNWAALWRPVTDSLGPVLGLLDPDTPYRADDGRITDLAVHRRISDTLGHRVDVEIWWQPLPAGGRPPITWPDQPGRRP
jgi:hypothetical protein